MVSAVITYNDDFDTLDFTKYLTRWHYTDPAAPGCSLPSNGELELYVNSDGPLTTLKPWTVNNSILTLTCWSDPTVGYVSGMINTFGKFSQMYGYFEVRAKVPPGSGLWPAFWLLPSNGSWPPEIDVFEILGRDPTTLYVTDHTTLGPNMGGPISTVDLSNDFHVYGCDWTADTITWYLDDRQVSQVSTPADNKQPMYLILNLALGGSWAGPPDASKLPAQFEIDYLRVWDSKPEIPVGTKYTVTSPWANVRPTVWNLGDTLSLDFTYNDISILPDPDGSTCVWIRTGAQWTLAAQVPGPITVLG